MAPGGGGKRKRGERTFSQDSRENGERPSPHRPGDLRLGRQGAQHQTDLPQDQQRALNGQAGRARGRRGGRGGRGRVSQRNQAGSPNKTHIQASQISESTIPKFPPTLSPKTTSERSRRSLAESRLPPGSIVAQVPEAPPAQSISGYEYITSERISSWSDVGRKEVVGLGIKAVQNDDAMALGLLFEELVDCALHGRLSFADAGSTVREILQESIVGQSNDATSIFLDTISIIAETTVPTPDLLSLIAATGITAQQLRHELDSSVLELLGLVRKNVFVRVGIRQQTNLLYRQSNYNLLREESEGYSKLVTDLFTTSNNELATNEVVEETFERVKGMIGAFDLDVGRVLDISLDVFGTVLVKQYRFFIKYFRASSWWPQENMHNSAPTKLQLGPLPRWALPASVGRALNEEEKIELSEARFERDGVFWQRAQKIGMPAFFELGGRHANEKHLEATTAAIKGTQSSQSQEERRWIEITKTLPPCGSKVAAQILGFKLRFYVSPARDTSASDSLPPNIIYLAALLVKIGFVSLLDLYPHLWPGEDGMETLREEKMREKIEKEAQRRPGGGVPNALASAKPLSEEPDLKTDPRETAGSREIEAVRRVKRADVPSERASPGPQAGEKSEEPSKRPLEQQKVQLLKSLLTIGAIPEALYMFGRFPWIVEAFTDMPEYIHRILHHSLSAVYEPLRPMQHDSTVQEQQRTTEEGAARGLQTIKLVAAPLRRRKRWAQLDQDNVNEGDEVVDYRFYWDEWADMIPVCQSVDDVFTLCSTFLNLSGVRIGQDPALLMKLARIGINSLIMDTSSSNINRWIDLSKRLLVPALSFTKSNPGVVNEIYELLKHFSYPVRYSIYAEWNSGQVSRQPEMKSQFEFAKAETKAVLKRISKTNLKQMARALAKIAYSNPGVVFAVAIAQLESYDNIIDVVVECARYFTYLAYDVLTWSLMNALGGQGRTRVQADGMLTSRWLAALSLFTGKMFKRYSVLTPVPIMQYVADQLRKSNPTDLIVIEEIVSCMAGIVSDNTFNEAQALAMAGGDLLQHQTFLQLLDKRHESKNTAKRLMKFLTDSKLAGQLLILIAQERQTCIFKIDERNAHPKLLGNLYDKIHRIFVQYIESLRYNLSTKEFDQSIPSVVQLISEFGIDVGIAFWISRPSIFAAMSECDAKYGNRFSNSNLSMKDSVETEFKTDEQTSEIKSPEVNESSKAQPTASNLKEGKEEDHDSTKQASNDDPSNLNGAATAGSDAALEPWHPVLNEMMDNLQSALPSSDWKSMSVSFYVTFWQCSLHDVFFPVQSYEDEIQRQRRNIGVIKADREYSTAAMQRKDREIKVIEDLADRLQKESKERFQTYNQLRPRLRREKDHWFAGFWGRADDLNMALVEQCFFPRLILSPVDAMYTFKMLKYLHSSGATNFRTVGVYDQLFISQRLASVIFLCSAREAENLGRFLHQLLSDLSTWHKDKAKFEKEAYGIKKDLPGFAKRTTQDKKPITDFYEFEDFRRVLRKWHMNLTNALKTCLISGEYMHIRNAINILNNIYQNFPAITFMGKQIVECVTKLSQTESRGDLKLAAASLLGNLKRMEKDWVMPQAFNLVESGLNANNNGGRSGSVNPSTPRSESDANKSLNPKAPNFQPNLKSNERQPKALPGSINSEDGEINDAQMADVHNTDSPLQTANALKGPTTDITTNAKSRPASPRPSEPKLPSAQSKVPTPKSQPEAFRADVIPTNPSIPPKPDISRNTSASTRGQQGLPARPELSQVRKGDHRIPPRPSDRAGPDAHKDSRFPERPPTERPLEPIRGRSERGPLQDSEKSDIRSRPDRTQRSAGDSAPVARSNAGARNSSHTFRDQRSYPENAPHSSGNNSLQSYGQTQNTREHVMPPPKATASQNSETAPINPERAALIHGRQDNNRSHPVHQSSDHRGDGMRRGEISRSEHNSRGASPTRGTDRGSSFEGRRFDRKAEDGYRTGTEPANARPRYEENHAPSGPRMDRMGSQPNWNPSSDRSRESMKSAAPSRPALFESTQGRLNQDQNDGRLNPSNDVPSGPRMPNGNHTIQGRGGRNVSAPQLPSGPHQSSSTQSNAGVPVGQDRQTTNGPSVRGPMRDMALNTDSSPASNSGTTSVQGPETPIHPDRLRAMQASIPSGQNSVHSDRVPAIEGTGPQRRSSGPNRNEPNRGPGPRTLPQLSVAPGEGPPRGTATLPSPVQQSPTNRGGPPPTGPSFGGGVRDKRFAGVNPALQRSGPSVPSERHNQVASIRGRGRGMMPPSPSSSGPPQPNFPSTHEAGMNRDEPYSGRSNGPPAHGNANDEPPYGRGGRRGPARETREGERRSGRHRSRSPGNDGPPDGHAARLRDNVRPPDPRDHFRNDMGPPMNIRGSGPGQERDMRGPPPGLPPPMTEREPRGGRATRASTREEPIEGRSGRDGGYDGRDGGGREGGGSLRKRGRGGEEMGGERHMDNKRPRR